MSLKLPLEMGQPPSSAVLQLSLKISFPTEFFNFTRAHLKGVLVGAGHAGRCPVAACRNWTEQDDAGEKSRCEPRTAIRTALVHDFSVS